MSLCWLIGMFFKCLHGTAAFRCLVGVTSEAGNSAKDWNQQWVLENMGITPLGFVQGMATIFSANDSVGGDPWLIVITKEIVMKYTPNT